MVQAKHPDMPVMTDHDDDMSFPEQTAATPRSSDPLTSHRLLPEMYDKLRQLAAYKMSRESGMQTLQPTALAHEAWMRMTSSRTNWENQAHFMGAAAEAMRRILVDRTRAKMAVKRQLTDDVARTMKEDQEQAAQDQNHILLIHEALKRLELEDPNAAEIVVLKFFSGFTSEEIATMLDKSVRTVERQWTFAKARLFQIIKEDLDPVMTDETGDK